MLPLMLLVGLFLAPVAIAVSALLDDVVAEGALAGRTRWWSPPD
jgi:hypothetical protein